MLHAQDKNYSKVLALLLLRSQHVMWWSIFTSGPDSACQETFWPLDNSSDGPCCREYYNFIQDSQHPGRLRVYSMSYMMFNLVLNET